MKFMRTMSAMFAAVARIIKPGAPLLAFGPSHRTGPGRCTLDTHHRARGKWSGEQLRAIRARNGIGRPPIRPAS